MFCTSEQLLVRGATHRDLTVLRMKLCEHWTFADRFQSFGRRFCLLPERLQTLAHATQLSYGQLQANTGVAYLQFCGGVLGLAPGLRDLRVPYSLEVSISCFLTLSSLVSAVCEKSKLSAMFSPASRRSNS